MIATLTLTDLADFVGRGLVSLSGGGLGVYVPDFLAFYSGEKSFAVLDLVLLTLLCVFPALRAVEGSRLGLLTRAMRDDEVPASVKTWCGSGRRR